MAHPVQEALAAREQTHGYKLDKAHTFAVTLFDDFERYVKVPDQYQEYQPAPYKPTVRAAPSMSDSQHLRATEFDAVHQGIAVRSSKRKLCCQFVAPTSFTVSWEYVNVTPACTAYSLITQGGPGCSRCLFGRSLLTRFLHCLPERH